MVRITIIGIYHTKYIIIRSNVSYSIKYTYIGIIFYLMYIINLHIPTLKIFKLNNERIIEKFKIII